MPSEVSKVQRRAQVFAAMLVTALVAGMALTENAEAPSVPIGTRLTALSFRDIDGVPYTLADLQPYRATVFVFFSVYCPMCRKYPQRIAQLHATFSQQGVAFFIVNPMSHEPLDELRQYARDVGWQIPLVKDWALAKALGATVTPQVVVLDSDGVVRYRGRIDDNADATQVTRHDLRDA